MTYYSDDEEIAKLAAEWVLAIVLLLVIGCVMYFEEKNNQKYWEMYYEEKNNQKEKAEVILEEDIQKEKLEDILLLL